MRYECIIAPVKNPSDEQTVLVEAKDGGDALVISSQTYPGTYVKSLREI